MYLWFANVVLFGHVGLVLFVISMLPLIIVGGCYAWTWVRDPWIRCLHLLCIVIVVVESWLGFVCPLTSLEMWLRDQGKQSHYSGSFIAHWLQKMLFWELSNAVFMVLYTTFAVLILAAWYWVRPLPFNEPRSQ